MINLEQVLTPYEVPEWRKSLNIHQRVAAAIGVIAKMGPIGRDGENAQQKYRFTSHNAIKEAITPVLAHFGIVHKMVEVEIEHSQRVQPGAVYNGQKNPDKDVFGVQCVFRMELINVDDPKDSLIWERWTGAAEDYADKAVNKAQTAAEKTFLSRTFKIVSGDEDGDARQVEDTYRAQHQARPAQERPQRQAASLGQSRPAQRSTETRNGNGHSTSALRGTTATAVATPADAPPDAPARRQWSARELLRLAIESGEDPLPATAIEARFKSEESAAAATWVAKTHRVRCASCHEATSISAMLAAHPPADTSEDDLLP